MLCIGSLSSQTIRLATYRYASNDRIANISPLGQQLEKALGTSVTVKSYNTVHEFIDGIRNNEVDIALINTFGYLLLEASDKSFPMLPKLALEVKADAKDNYKTVIAARSNVPVATLSDLSSRAGTLRMSFVAEGSTSGNLVPRLALSGAGINNPEKSFRKWSYSGNHATAIELLLKDSTDIAAMGHTEYEKLQADPVKAKQLKQIWLSPEIPLGPVLLNKKLSPAQQQRIIDCFLTLEQTNEPALSAVKAGWSEAKQATHYISIGADFYTPFKSTLGSPVYLQEILRRFAN